MKPDDVRMIREAFGEVVGHHVSQGDFAHAIGLTPPNGGERVREFEDGKRETTGPVDRAIGYMKQGLASLDVPQYIIGDPEPVASVSATYAYMVRLWWPRFVARIDPIDSPSRRFTPDAFKVNEILYLTIVQWIDDPSLFGRGHKFYGEHAVAHFREWDG